MRARLKLKPGQPGTKKLVLKYGDKLVCVRYRYDVAQGKRYKTVELIEEAIVWPPAPAGETLVAVKVKFEEAALRQQVKEAGGQWNATLRRWIVRYDQAVALGLQERVTLLES